MTQTLIANRTLLQAALLLVAASLFLPSCRSDDCSDYCDFHRPSGTKDAYSFSCDDKFPSENDRFYCGIQCDRCGATCSGGTFRCSAKVESESPSLISTSTETIIIVVAVLVVVIICIVGCIIAGIMCNRNTRRYPNVPIQPSSYGAPPMMGGGVVTSTTYGDFGSYSNPNTQTYTSPQQTVATSSPGTM